MQLEGVEAVLRLQSIAHARIAQGHAKDFPVTAEFGHGAVRVRRLVCAVKGAESEVDNADSCLVARIPRNRGPRAAVAERSRAQPAISQ